MKIEDGSNNYMRVTTDGALLVENISQLIETLKRTGAVNGRSIEMKDNKTGEIFTISYEYKENA